MEFLEVTHAVLATEAGLSGEQAPLLSAGKVLEAEGLDSSWGHV